MNIEHYTRVGRLLAELHGDEVLSEQQCAKIMGVDLVSWRIIEHTFSRGSWGETVDESGPMSEEAILAALPNVDAETERKQFEDWAVGWRDEHNAPLFIMLRDNGKYMDRATEKAWWGWSARAGVLPF